MLGEFPNLVNDVINVLEACKSITTNTAIDDIDMTSLEFDFPTLTNIAFGVETSLLMTQSIARKEAYDFLAGYTRLALVHSRGRSDYYSGASAELDISIEHIEYLVGVLTSLEQFVDR